MDTMKEKDEYYAKNKSINDQKNKKDQNLKEYQIKIKELTASKENLRKNIKILNEQHDSALMALENAKKQFSDVTSNSNNVNYEQSQQKVQHLHVKSKISELRQTRDRLAEVTNSLRDMVSSKQNDYDNLVRSCDSQHKNQMDSLQNWSKNMTIMTKKVGKNPWKLSATEQT